MTDVARSQATWQGFADRSVRAGELLTQRRRDPRSQERVDEGSCGAAHGDGADSDLAIDADRACAAVDALRELDEDPGAAPELTAVPGHRADEREQPDIRIIAFTEGVAADLVELSGERARHLRPARRLGAAPEEVLGVDVLVT